MKGVLCALLACLSWQWAQANTASIVAHSYSLRAGPAFVVGTNEQAAILYFTTFDGRSGLPRHDTLPTGMVRVSDELRPRIGHPGTYEADYIIVSVSEELVEYGSITLNFPTADDDGDGLPNFIEIDRAASIAISGTSQSDWPLVAQFELNGRFEREQNETRGSLALTSGSFDLTGAFEVLQAEGALEYSLPFSGRVGVRLSFRNGNGSRTAFTGSAPCMVANSNELSVGQFTLRDRDGNTRTVLPSKLTRAGAKYAGMFQFSDGNPQTSWDDFESWGIEIIDGNDANGNGVPDLSDVADVIDTTAPTVKISAPEAGAEVRQPFVLISGIARDNLGISRVEYRTGDGPFKEAAGTTEWTASATLMPGTNVVAVRAFDLAGNVSVEARHAIISTVLSPLIVQIDGSGTVSPHYSGKELVVGRSYSLTARPTSGYVFSHWTSGGDVFGPTIGFTMQSNLMVHAHFVPNPFSPMAGTFNGLFYRADGVSVGTAGSLRVSLSQRGTYTARLIFGGGTNIVAGRFDVNGHSSARFSRGQVPIVVELQLDLQSRSLLRGTVSIGDSVSELMAVRAAGAQDGGTNFAGRYTLAMGSAPYSSAIPHGSGFASMAIDSNGKVRVTGRLGDGTPFTHSTGLGSDGAWPFYVPLYRGRGLILGWVRCTSPPNIVDSTVTWIRPASSRSRYYPAGFSANINLSGSGYAAPGTNRVLSCTNALIIISGGNLPTSITNRLVFDAANAVSNLDTNVVSLSINPANGQFHGVFNAPGILNRKYSGALLQKQKSGAGYFLGTNESGRLQILAVP